MRRFFSPAILIPASIAVGLSIAARAQIDRERDRPADAGRPVRLYEGVSNRGQLQEALDNAVNDALTGLPGADRMVRYRVREITGEQGGIAGTNRLRVSIEVEGEAGRRPAPPRPPRDTPGETLRQLQPRLRLSPARVDRAGTVDMELEIQNPTDQPVRVPLSSGQRYDFEVRRNDRVIWRWSDGRFFTQALTTLTIPEGRSATYRETWNLRNRAGMRVPPGVYTVRAWIPTAAQDARLEATAELTITGP